MRYSLPGRGTGLPGFLSLVSLLGLSLGVFSLIVVISVMNGFERELQSRLLSLLPHAQLTHEQLHYGDTVIAADAIDGQALVAAAVDSEGITGAAPYVEATVMLNANQRIRSAAMTGIDLALEHSVSDLHRHIIAGDLQSLAERPYGIVIGSLLARQLGVIPGDKITMTIPKIRITPFGPVTREKRFTVVAVFEVGAELDQNLVLTNINAAQKLLGNGHRIDGIRLATDEQFQSIAITEAMLEQLIRLDAQYSKLTLIDWRESNRSLFSAVVMEKLLIALLLMSVVAVASFNIVSIILMTITDKRSDIAVLRTMGADAQDIRRLFILQGLFIGTVGTGIGAALALLVAPNAGRILRAFEDLSGWRLFDPAVYFIPYLPSELRLTDVAIVVFVAMLISLFATLYPAGRAAKIAPAEALAYEH